MTGLGGGGRRSSLLQKTHALAESAARRRGGGRNGASTHLTFISNKHTRCRFLMVRACYSLRAGSVDQADLSTLYGKCFVRREQTRGERTCNENEHSVQFAWLPTLLSGSLGGVIVISGSCIWHCVSADPELHLSSCVSIVHSICACARVGSVNRISRLTVIKD